LWKHHSHFDITTIIDVPDRIKRHRPPQEEHGQARTRLARRAVVTAARTLFLERGYARTTIDAVSALSDVPVATVYRLFATKLGILRALVDTSIGGDDQPLAVQDRPDVAALLSESDPTRLLSGLARLTTAINQRTNEVYRVLVSAAASDLAAAALLADLQDQRDRGQIQIVRALLRCGGLRAGLSQRDAADLVHALISPDLYRLLVVDRGWSPERFERWLAATLVAQLT
jgi:AcrR family transcriptional regulator